MRSLLAYFVNIVSFATVCLFAVSCSDESDDVRSNSSCDSSSLSEEPSDGFRLMRSDVPVDTTGVVLRKVYDDTHNKAARYSEIPSDVTDTHFHDCGYTSINGASYKTVIIGNQRWTVKDYSLKIDAYGEDWEDDKVWKRFLFKVKKESKRYVYYFPYEFAMTFTDYEAEEDDGVPEGFEATTGWRIPSEEDVSNLYHLARQNLKYNHYDVDSYIIENLQLKVTDLYVLYSVYVVPEEQPGPDDKPQYKYAEEIIYKDFGLFWNSDKHYETYTFAGMGNDGNFWYCQSNRDTICAPIRFVQNVKPLDFND